MALAGICTITLSSSSCDNFLSVDGLTSSNVFYALIFVITSLSFQREHKQAGNVENIDSTVVSVGSMWFQRCVSSGKTL